MIRIHITKIYNDLDELPIGTWRKIHEKGNISLLIKRGMCTIGTLNRKWIELQNEHLDKRGINDSYREFIKKKIRYLKVCSNYLISKSLDDLQEARLLEMDLEVMNKKLGDGTTFEEIYGWLIGTAKVHLPLRLTATNEYYYILDSTIKINSNGKAD